MEKVKTELVEHVPAGLADELAQLPHNREPAMVRAFFAGSIFGVLLMLGITVVLLRRANRRLLKERASDLLNQAAKPRPRFKHLRDVDTTDLRFSAIVFVESTEQYFTWIPSSLLTVDGVLVVGSSRDPRVGRFVLDERPWEPWEAACTAESL